MVQQTWFYNSIPPRIVSLQAFPKRKQAGLHTPCQRETGGPSHRPGIEWDFGETKQPFDRRRAVFLLIGSAATSTNRNSLQIVMMRSRDKTSHRSRIRPSRIT